MSVLNLFKKVKAQIDPFDNGATFSNPAARPRPQPVPAPAQRGPLPLYSRDQTSQRFMGAPRNDSEQGLRGLTLPIWAPTANPVAKPLGYEAPDDRTKQVLDQAATVHRWTPEFRDIVNRAQPRITQQLDSRGLKNGSKAAGTYQSNNGTGRPYNQYINPQQISLDPKYAVPDVITHEGLHAAYSSSPQTRRDFGKAYNTSATPDLKNSLARRTRNYKTQAGSDFNDYNKLTPSMRTESHSYLSEQPQLPKGLQDYYSRFIDVNGTTNRLVNQYRTQRSIQDSLDLYRFRRPQEPQGGAY